jgi:GxxExxY protein
MHRQGRRRRKVESCPEGSFIYEWLRDPECILDERSQVTLNEHDINQVSGVIVDAAMTVHRALGAGLLESAYEACLAYELRARGLEVAQQVGLPITYGRLQMDIGYRVDMIIADAVIVEVKSVAKLLPIHQAQILSYLCLSGLRLGLLLNFNAGQMRQGIRRVVNNL